MRREFQGNNAIMAFMTRKNSLQRGSSCQRQIYLHVWGVPVPPAPVGRLCCLALVNI